jgi:hypothetical protein
VDSSSDRVDANPPSPDRRDSDRRDTTLFATLLLSVLPGGLPALLVAIGMQRSEEAREARQRLDRLQQVFEKNPKAVYEGRSGETIRRLLGIDAPPAPERRLPGEAEKPQRAEK